MLLTSYVNGSTAGSPPPPRDHYFDAKRGDVGGWSTGSIRRNQKWLFSIDAQALVGSGLALTLTLGRTPPTSAEWKSLRDRLFHRMRKDPSLEMIGAHWVVEWTKRQRPHLHMAVYVEGGRLEAVRAMYTIVRHWLDLAESYGARYIGQHGDHITDAAGWFAYVSKHAARGIHHYQRWASPPEWESTGTGRVWGHLGAWPVVEPKRFKVPPKAFWRFRREVRLWRLTDAREAYARLLGRPTPRPGSREAESRYLQLRAARRRIVSARGMLRCNERKLSEVRGVSEWIPEHVMLDIVARLHADGFDIEEL